MQFGVSVSAAGGRSTTASNWQEMWTSTGPSYYRGEFVEFRQVGTFPKPHQKPHPPS